MIIHLLSRKFLLLNKNPSAMVNLDHQILKKAQLEMGSNIKIEIFLI